MKPSLNQQRNTRLDFFRGLALLTIFINHVPQTVFADFTYGNFGFTDAADIFVFMAGIAAAYAYGKLFMLGASLKSTLKSWSRALILYCIHITITLLALALVAGFSLYLNDSALLQKYNIAPLINDPVSGFIGIAILGHQLGYFNILPLYSVLLLLLPLALWLAKKSHALLIVSSLVLWMAAMVFWLNFPTYPQNGGWTFNPLAWQLLFVCGLLVGLSKGVTYNRHLFFVSVVYLLLALLCVIYNGWGIPGKTGLPWFIVGFDKTYITPLRFLHLLAIAYVVINLPWLMKWSNVKPTNIIALLGRHALPVFAVGSLLSVVAQLIKFAMAPSLVLDTLLIVTGIGLQMLLAQGLEWKRALWQAPTPLPDK